MSRSPTRIDAGMWIDGSDPDLTTLDMKPGVARDMHVLPTAMWPHLPTWRRVNFCPSLSKERFDVPSGLGRMEFANRSSRMVRHWPRV